MGRRSMSIMRSITGALLSIATGLLLPVPGTAGGPARGEDPGVLVSYRAPSDWAPTADPHAPPWEGMRGVWMERDRRGEPVPGHRTEVRSRWTGKNLYLLFVCPYEELHLRPAPSTATETNRLWEWDVAEAFIGTDFEDIRRYTEFQVSPQGEWIDLAIDLSAQPGRYDRTWESGFAVKARLDPSRKVWYGEMRIPMDKIDRRPPRAGQEMRINLYRIQGPPPNRRWINWQPVMSDSFHTPEAFGRLRLEESGAAGAAHAGARDAGRRAYESRCSRCHGGDGNGGPLGPAIVTRLPIRSDEELALLVREGLPGSGMPGFPMADPEMGALVAFLRSLRPARGSAPVRARVETTEGLTLEGLALNQGSMDMQLLTDDRRIHLLRKVDERYRPVAPGLDWPTYNGQAGGNRYSALDRINKENVGRLAPAWMFTLADASRLEVTPVVVDGVMYVTSANECLALDAGNGRRIWHYKRPRTRGLAGDAAGGINRGVAVAGERVFMVTDHAHLIALDRFTGALLWETEMADWRQNYGATSAPLVVGDRVVSGISGGDEGVRGFLAAFDRETGREVWRFWTVPKRGEPGSETWRGRDIDHPCASTWLTGTYDPELGTLYWPTGNPCPDHNGDEREGDNLYSDSILALDARTGRLKWYYQYTPHDLWDWDAQQPPVLVDADWQGQPRRLLLHANRNGFFYVLDRTDGRLLLSRPFVRKLTWAREIGADGRPVLNPGQEPTPEGTRVCPAVEGATNWFSTSFNPATGLYYVQTLEKCSIYTKATERWQPGRSYYGGSTRPVPEEVPRKVLRALDIRTGEAAWELPQAGPANSWGGTLATAGGLVFFGEDGGAFMAADAESGRPLWHFPINNVWKASPMTYLLDGRQHVAVASGPNVISFALSPTIHETGLDLPHE